MKNEKNAPASAQLDRGASQPHPSQAFLHEPPHYEVRFGSGHVAPYSDIKRQPLKPSAATIPPASQPVAPVAAQADIEQRTEKIRLVHANPTGRSRTHLIRDVAHLLAHIALLRPTAAPPSDAKDATVPYLGILPSHSEREAANAGGLHQPVEVRVWPRTYDRKTGTAMMCCPQCNKQERHRLSSISADNHIFCGGDGFQVLSIDSDKFPATIAAGQEAANAKDAERGWCLERGLASEPRYLHVAETGIFEWTQDHMKALRFSRRADAEQVAHIVEDADRIAEHIWMNSPVAVGAAGQEGGNHG